MDLEYLEPYIAKSSLFQAQKGAGEQKNNIRRIAPRFVGIRGSTDRGASFHPEQTKKSAKPKKGRNQSWQHTYFAEHKLTSQKHSLQEIIAGRKNAPPAVNCRRRNEYMIDHADVLLAVYDNDGPIRIGTAMTVNCTRKKGLPVILIHPDRATVTKENGSREY